MKQIIKFGALLTLISLATVGCTGGPGVEPPANGDKNRGDGAAAEKSEGGAGGNGGSAITGGTGGGMAGSGGGGTGGAAGSGGGGQADAGVTLEDASVDAALVDGACVADGGNDCGAADGGGDCGSSEGGVARDK